MKEYISTIIYIAIFSIILELILPNNKLKKYITSLIGLLVVLVISNPVINFLKNEDVVLAISTAIDELTINNEEIKAYDFSKERDRIINSSVKEKLEQEIKQACDKELSKYKINGVSINLDKEYKVEAINITASNVTDVEDARKIINYITDAYNVQEQVINIIKGD